MVMFVMMSVAVLMLVMVMPTLIADMNMIARHARLAKHRPAIARTTAGIAHSILLLLILVKFKISPIGQIRLIGLIKFPAYSIVKERTASSSPVSIFTRNSPQAGHFA
jgi:hypothetical protein